MTELTDLAELHRVETEHGSRVEPELDQAWSKLDKLRWLARVVEIDNALPLGWFDVRQQGEQYSVSYAGASWSWMSYSDVWTQLVYLGEGVRMIRRLES